MGGPFWFSVLMSWFLLVEAARVAATVWLSVWTDSVDDGSTHGPFYFLAIYTIISGVQVLSPLAAWVCSKFGVY